MRISALALEVRGAQPLVGEIRARYDPSGRRGFPPHITLLAPFVPPDEITDALLDDLRELFGRLGPFDFELTRTGRFPGTLYLAPEPVERVAGLIDALVARYPDYPPYGGEFDTVVPHLTVAHGVPEPTLAALELVVASGLPLRARAHTVVLMEGDPDAGYEDWHERATFSLGRD